MVAGGTDQAQHFVRAASDLLVSHVLVFPLSIEGHRGVLRVGCVGAVLTFPRLRREGHASKLMRRAVQHIRQTADVGMLFCDAVNAPFYERLDWSALPRGRALVEGEIPDGVLMILGDDLIAPDPIRLPWVWYRPLERLARGTSLDPRASQNAYAWTEGDGHQTRTPRSGVGGYLRAGGGGHPGCSAKTR